MHGYLPRAITSRLRERLLQFPAVGLVGPRQCGKTTLVRQLVEGRDDVVYLDLERAADRRRLEDPDLYVRSRREAEGAALFCFDEIQRVPELFSALRVLIDEEDRPGQFLLLGSASRDLLQQSSESLAGRIVFLELTPLQAEEVDTAGEAALSRYWLRGGFPRSYLAPSLEASVVWRESFLRTFLERDIASIASRMDPDELRRTWRMLAHHHGQLLDASQLGRALGVSHTTVRSRLELLALTFMVRILEPLTANLGKRLIRSPRVYVRDPGVLHALLEIDTLDDLFGHPLRGASWEGLVIENAITALADWRPSFYRTAGGAEIDLVLERGRRRIAVEAKASSAPKPSRGFWSAMEDLGCERAFVVAPVDEGWPIEEHVEVVPLAQLASRLRETVSPS